jgi:hypothetical protein
MLRSESIGATDYVLTYMHLQYCPEDDYGSLPNALEGKGLEVILVFFDLKSDWPKRGYLRERTGGVRMVNELRTNGLRPTPGPPTLI